ncbi:hypothetical protein [Streptomyces platensis]
MSDGPATPATTSSYHTHGQLAGDVDAEIQEPFQRGGYQTLDETLAEYEAIPAG